MPRRNRFAPPGYWLHLTQRGNYRQTVFSSDADREHFLTLLETHREERGVRIAAYALMSNHFHLVAVGDRPDAVSLFMMNVNGQKNGKVTGTPVIGGEKTHSSLSTNGEIRTHIGSEFSTAQPLACTGRKTIANRSNFR